jgi:hypothetical protein
MSPTWQLLNMATGGNAAGYLNRCRDDGMTFQAIADLLGRDFSITVSREWVRLRLAETESEVVA